MGVLCSNRPPSALPAWYLNTRSLLPCGNFLKQSSHQTLDKFLIPAAMVKQRSLVQDWKSNSITSG
jgi:hypothetical protein